MEVLTRKDLKKCSVIQLIKIGYDPYRRLLSYLKPYWVRFSLGLLCGMLYGMANGLMVLMIQHVSEVIFPGSPGSKKEMLQTAMEGAGPPVSEVVLACAAVPAVMLLRNLLSYLNIYCLIWVGSRMLADMRSELFSHVISQSLDFFDRSKSGDLVQMIFNQTRMAQQVVTRMVSDIIKQPVSIISALAVLFTIDWKFTLVMFALFPACVLPAIIIGKRVRKSGVHEEEESGDMMVLMQEAFAGIRMIKSFSRESYEVQRFQEASNTIMKLYVQWQNAMAIVGPLVEVVASLGVGLALFYVAFFELGAPKFLALNAGLVMLYPPFKDLSRLHIFLQKCLACATKVFSVLETAPTVQDAPNAIQLESSKGEIAFKNVSFSYKKDTQALNNVSFKLENGNYYALVGRSGAGKSTIFSLIYRFYDPDDGGIYFDGYDLRSVTQASLREKIGIVNQEAFLFHDTIYNNIKYGKLNATDKEIHEAARRAYAHDFILEQSHGYDTVVGDKGGLLSGGQQQRICIARAILKNAPVLLLDEATSALDSEAEKKVQSALETLCEGRTVVAIAHRLSTILKADQIIVMEQGQVVDIGRHEELISRGGHYRHLYDLQFNSQPNSSASAESEEAVYVPA